MDKRVRRRGGAFRADLRMLPSGHHAGRISVMLADQFCSKDRGTNAEVSSVTIREKRPISTARDHEAGDQLRGTNLSQLGATITL